MIKFLRYLLLPVPAILLAAVAATGVFAVDDKCALDDVKREHTTSSQSKNCAAIEDSNASTKPTHQPDPDDSPAPEPEPSSDQEADPVPAPEHGSDAPQSDNPTPESETTTEPSPDQETATATQPQPVPEAETALKPVADPAPSVDNEIASRSEKSTEPLPLITTENDSQEATTSPQPMENRKRSVRNHAPRTRGESSVVARKIRQHKRQRKLQDPVNSANNDARFYREHLAVSPVPEQPRLTQSELTDFIKAASGSGTKWSTLAAISWLAGEWDKDNPRDKTEGSLSKQSASSQTSRAQKASDRHQRLRSIATYLAKGDTSTQIGRYYDGNDDAVERTLLLADYFNALGTQALVHGVDSKKVKERLNKQVLNDKRISIYDGGRSDIRDDLVDVRVLITLRFLANQFGSVGVSSITSGHRVFTSGGRVSLHAHGRAVDIASLGGEVITPASQAGAQSRTRQAVRAILQLPESGYPQELISLWNMGGPSFSAADHADHIHIGFGS